MQKMKWGNIFKWVDTEAAERLVMEAIERAAAKAE